MEKETNFFAPSILITTKKHKKKIPKNNIGTPSSIIAKTNTKKKPKFFVTFCILLLQKKHNVKTENNSFTLYPFCSKKT